MIHAIIFSLRIIFKYRGYSAVGILGLAIAIASCWFIANYVQHFYGFDKFHKNVNQIYRINMAFTAGESTDYFAPTGTPVGEILTNNYVGINAYAKLKFGADPVVKVKNQQFDERHFFSANPELLDVFTFDMLAGEKSKALAAPGSIILTRSLAMKYFGHIKVVGKELLVNETFYNITGVFEDWPKNSHIDIKALMAENNNNQEYDIQSWFDLEQYNYVLVDPKLSKQDIDDLLGQLITDEIVPELAGSGVLVKFNAEPLDGLYFEPGLTDDIKKGNLNYVNALAIAGFLVLLIAGLNYVNLGLTQSSHRRKEMGVRRILGISRWHLFRQRSVESLIITLLVLIFTAIIVVLIQPVYVALTGMSSLLDSVNWITLSGLLLIVFLSGLVGTGYTSLAVLFSKNAANTQRWSVNIFRKFLVSSQLAISSLILMATFVVYQQIDFINKKDLGFTADQVMVVELPDDEATPAKANALKAALNNYENIQNVSMISGGALPGEENGKELFEVMVNGAKEERVFNIYGVDESYCNLLDINFSEGRNFSLVNATDSTEAVIINQVLAKAMQWEKPIGQTIWLGDEPRKVIGVVQNFHNKSLHNVIEPIVFIYNQRYVSNLLIKTAPENVDLIQNLWPTFFVDSPFRLSYFDKRLAELYATENQLVKLLSYFAIISILLSCMGLVAVFSLHLHQKTKEMSIRKVFGANVIHLFGILTKSYLGLTLFSVGLAIVAAWLLKYQWLNTFIYKVEINPIVLGLLSLLVMSVVVVALTYHLLKLVRINPVETLKQD